MRTPSSGRRRAKRADQRPGVPPTGDAAGERDVPGRGAWFPIVGVGASAGGLEAFTQLLRALPPDTGMGFVLVQHLDPDHESALTHILSRATSLPVREITNDEPVQANHVHVIPRDTTLSIANGVLKIEPRQRTRAPHRPIDSFFESLAKDQRERAVGVVLSGTANDGTVGLEAIKAEGGITFAQDGSAKYDSMPRSAVAAGCVDLVLAPADIAKELARIAKHPYVARATLLPPTGDDGTSATAHQDDQTPLPSGESGADTRAEQVRAEAEGAGRGEAARSKAARGDQDYKRILLLLRNHSGVDFSLYKSSTIQRRITRRLVLNKQDTLEGYAGFLRGNAKELEALYSDVLISVTSFFRNPETFDVLQHKVLPELLKQRGDDPLRVWVLGCSTGQEAYSIAMAFVEAAEKAPRMRKLQIFATDLNNALLDKARHGLYAKSLVEDITLQRLRRFFVEEEGGYRVAKTLREMVVFARQNLMADPPFSRMDLISCRNLLIYLDSSLQQKAIPTFHYALEPGGFLLLGASESIGGFTDLFESLDKKHKIYSKKLAPIPTLALPLKKEHGGEQYGPRPPPLPMQRPGGSELPEGLQAELNAQREADRLTVNQFAPPGVLVNAELQVLQFRGPTGAFLEPPVGRASFDVLKMAREGLMLPLRSLINQAKKENRTTRKEKIRVKQDGKTRTVNLEVIPLKNLRERCFLILFEETDKASGRHETEPSGLRPGRKDRSPAREEPSRIAELESELSETREYLQSIQEQHEAATEELQAANEEVQSANEELQSVNEELETSKEELESANEELTTVNEEMSNRNIELHRLNNDLVNLQTSAKLAIVVLGRDLAIRRFSPQAEKQFDLQPTDVGRPISHIRHNLVVCDSTGSPLDLEWLCAEVISAVREQEREVRDKSGRTYSLRVRPYMTLDNRVDGAVLLLVDIDTLKRSERAVATARDYSENMVATVREPLLVLDQELHVESANRSFYAAFRVAPAETIGKHIYNLGNHQWDIPRLRELLEEIVPQKTSVEDFEVENEFEILGRRTMRLNARRIEDPLGESQRILVAIEDITERKRAEEALRESEERFRTLVEQVKDYAIFRTDPEGRATTWNEGVKRVLGLERDEFIGQDINETIFTLEDIQNGVPQLELETAVKTGTARSDRWMRRKNGDRFFAAGVTTALKDENGKLAGFTKVLHDQTEKVQVEEALQQSHADLSDADRRKNEFLAMLGHELRNPLTAVAHGLDLLGKVSDDRARSEELRGMMLRQTGRIGGLLDQLLDIARVISGKVVISKGPVDLVDVVRAAVETVKPLVETQKHELTLSTPSGKSVFVTGDAARLIEVVENLLTNAAKYTDEAGRIELTIESDEDKARITVRDNGIGMSAEFLPHVFEVFTQAPRTLDRAQGGLGLGLPLVRSLVEMHGGQVTASSPGLGQGSQFVVTLPRVHEKRSNKHLESAPSATGSPKIRPRRILVVDDEKDIAATLADLLQEEGHQPLGVNDGPAALAAIRTFDPEVVLLDLGLPGMDGYEVARRLREEHGDKKILLIAVTGYQDDAARLKQAGFDRHLIKPPDIRSLSALLAACDSDENVHCE